MSGLHTRNMVLDTNILIAYLGGEEEVVNSIQEWRRDRTPLFVSSVSECEIFSYPKLTSQEQSRIERFLKENFVAISFDGFIARQAAAVRRAVPSLKLPDAAIAALALHLDTQLVTRNLKDFKKVRSLSVLSL
jgi:tRNA(fMet)-specific endonuclease VapC